MNLNQSKNTFKPVPTAYDFFTGGETKTADFTIYYNVAFDNIVRVQNQIKDRTVAQQNIFLSEYFWKSHLQNKNKSGYEVTAFDGKIIQQLIHKVEDIRNFHSHIWHDNSVLAFTNELKQFIEKKYNEAKAALFAEYPSALTDYEFLQQTTYKGKFELFKSVQGDYYISLEGRIFVVLNAFMVSGP